MSKVTFLFKVPLTQMPLEQFFLVVLVSDTETKKILFAEVENDFMDFLLSILFYSWLLLLDSLTRWWVALEISTRA